MEVGGEERERARQNGPHESSAQHRAVGKRGETEDRGAERERYDGRAVLIVMGVLAAIVGKQQVTEWNDRRDQGRPRA